MDSLSFVLGVLHRDRIIGFRNICFVSDQIEGNNAVVKFDDSHLDCRPSYTPDFGVPT
jgi:hypothetical protein